MSTLILKPNFNKLNRALVIPTKSINYFIETEIRDTLDFYQKEFGVYSYMKLNKLQKFVLHSVTGVPLIWQPHNSCSFDPTGNLRVGKQEVDACNAKLNSSLCYDELFDSCYEIFMSWNSSAPITLDASGINMINRLVKTLATNAALGARMTLTAGKLYDANTVTFNSKTTQEIKDLFKLTSGTCKGWIELLKELGLRPETRHCDFKDIFETGDFNGAKYQGDPIALYDALYDAAPSDLITVLNEGGVASAVDGTATPVFLVSSSIYNQVANKYREFCVSNTCLNPRLTRREYNVAKLGGSTRPVFVYFIDDTPVIPVTDTNQYTKYLNGETHLAVLTVSGNISLGSSFADLPSVTESNIGMRIERLETNQDWGKYTFLAHALFASMIADTNYVSATQVYATY